MITKMNFISALFMLAMAVGCKKEGAVNTNDLYVNSPATPIPAELKGGLWFWGGFGRYLIMMIMAMKWVMKPKLQGNTVFQKLQVRAALNLYNTWG